MKGGITIAAPDNRPIVSLLRAGELNFRILNTNLGFYYEMYQMLKTKP